ERCDIGLHLRIILGERIQHANPSDALALLRARRERPRRRAAADERDELSPPHVSRATVWRSLSGWLAAHSGYHRGTAQVLRADLNRSEVSRLLISQGFLPRSGTNRHLQDALRNKRFFRASGTTADQRARSSFVQRRTRS